MLTCREILDFLADYHSGEVAPPQRTEFERHLAVCPPCVAYLNNYRDTIALAKGAYDDAEESGLCKMPEELVHAVLAARGKGGG